MFPPRGREVSKMLLSLIIHPATDLCPVESAWGIKKRWSLTRTYVTHRGDQRLPKHCIGCSCGAIWGHPNMMIFSCCAHSCKVLFLLPICEEFIQEWVAQRRWFTFTEVLHFLQLHELEHQEVMDFGQDPKEFVHQTKSLYLLSIWTLVRPSTLFPTASCWRN